MSIPKARTALVSGAGIAGPALAFWLASSGWAVTVVERARGIRPGGQAVDLRGPARTVADRMRLLDEIRRIRLHQKGIAWVRDDGTTAARVTADAFAGEGIVSEIEVLRGDLARLLYDATRRDVEFVFDDTVTALAQDDEGVSVRFERSGPRRFDLVVGADGLHSTVRALAFAPEPRCTRPLGLHMAWFTAPAEIDIGEWFQVYNAPGGRVASLRPGRIKTEHKAGLSFRSGLLTSEGADAEDQKALIIQKFHDVGWHVPRLLASLSCSDDFVLDTAAQVHLPRWSRGRVVLLGDAAWCPTPLTGLGTSTAIVGAYILAVELADAPGPAEACRRYERFMRPYITQAQTLPPGGVAAFAPETELGIKSRRAMMRAINYWPLKQVVTKQIRKSADIDLPAPPKPNVSRRGLRTI